MNLFTGTAIFAGRKDIYYLLSIVILFLGIGFFISAYLSPISNDLFSIMVFVGFILVLLSIVTIIITYKSK